MTKADIVERVKERTGRTKKEAEEITNLFFELLSVALSEGETIKISGFGGFEVNEKQARRGRNPQTGEEITIAARKVLTFKPGKALKDSVNAKG